ncbi:MAG: hypothetical protein KC560_01780, partial [Myxococcales bacterium]|nr:hypothetical protein [Myxococcales bacterium]
AWPLAAAGVLAWGAVAVAALAYYGDPLPNTYYAKSHPLSLAIVERGALFTWHYLRVHAFAPLVAVALALGVLARRPADPRLASAALLGAFVVWYLRIGGDALVYYRMWAWAQPLVALLLGHAVGALLAPPAGLARRALVAVAAALPLACLPNSFAGFDIAYLRTDDARIRDLGALGRFLAARAPHATIAANAIGAVGFASRLPVVDMLGLTSARVARAPGKALGVPGHESHDGAWVLDQRPDVVLVGIPRASAAPLPIEQAFQPAFPSDLDLLADPRFRRDYAFGHVQLPDGRFVALFLYRDGALGAAVSAPSGGGAPAP